MTNKQKIDQLQQEIVAIRKNLEIAKLEDHNRKYEYQQYVGQQEGDISEIQADIAYLQSFPEESEYIQESTAVDYWDGDSSECQ